MPLSNSKKHKKGWLVNFVTWLKKLLSVFKNNKNFPKNEQPPSVLIPSFSCHANVLNNNKNNITHFKKNNSNLNNFDFNSLESESRLQTFKIITAMSQFEIEKINSEVTTPKPWTSIIEEKILKTAQEKNMTLKEIKNNKEQNINFVLNSSDNLKKHGDSQLPRILIRGW